MRFALAFALMIAVCGIFAIAVGQYLAHEAAALYEQLNTLLEDVHK